MDVSESLYHQLNALGFSQFLKIEGKRKEFRFLSSLEFTADMFGTTNKLGFQCVYFFLFKKLSDKTKLNRWEKDAKAVIPCLDPSQEADFRKLVVQFLESIEKDLEFSRDKVNYNAVLMSPGGSAFIRLTLKVVSFVMTKFLSLEARSVAKKTSSLEASTKIKDVLNSKQQESKRFELEAERFHSNIDPMKMEMTRLLADRNELKDILAQLHHHFCQTFGHRVDTADSHVVVQELEKLLFQVASAAGSLSVDESLASLYSSFKPKDVILQGCLENAVTLQKIVELGTSKVNSTDLRKQTVVNQHDLKSSDKLCKEVTDLVNVLKKMQETCESEVTQAKERLLNHPEFKRKYESVMKVIGITKPLPVIEFEAMKATSDEQTQRWRSLASKRQETRVAVTSAAAKYSPAPPKDCNDNDTTPPCHPDISFSVSMLDHSLFSPVERYRESLGLLNIPESDNED